MKGVLVVASALVVVLLASLQIATAQGSGAIVINARAGGQPAKADVVVYTATADPQEVAKGQAGTPISVPSGSYDVEIICKELLDHPSQRLQAVKVAGDAVEREVTFPAGTTVLNVKKGGRALRNVELRFKKTSGEEVPGTARPGVAFKMSPGQYEAEIVMGKGRSKATHTITGIQVYDGAKRTIPVSL
jgi:hypothetical protein